MIEILKNNFIQLVQSYSSQNSKPMHILEEKNTKDNSTTTVSCILDYSKYNVRFIYKINGGYIFKKGIITLNINIGMYEFNFTDILSQINSQDKDAVIFPYVDNIDTMKKCLDVLFSKLNRYSEKILNLATDNEQKNKLVTIVLKEIQKIFKGNGIIKEKLNFRIFSLYSDTALIRYTSKGYAYFLNGKYTKAYKWYKKQKNLCMYEQQLLGVISKNIKKENMLKHKKDKNTNNKKRKIKKYVLSFNTINHKKEARRENAIYTIISGIILASIAYAISYVLKCILSMAIYQETLYIVYMSNVMLLAPTLVLTCVFNAKFRNYLFKKQIPNTIALSELYKTEHLEFKKRIYAKAFILSSIFSIGLIVSNSIVFKKEYIRYSNNIFDVKGNILEYTEIEKVEKNKIVLKSGVCIDLEEYDTDMNRIIEIITENIE